ncbi:hypothetical protein [Pseudomonas sp.]|uniref:hypothetical protein n=1 Tax=Pseudomonas sp. TaxID=306 RepID=UPI00260B29CF|nr:hypothetical protein [Pseudomonas sp.]
MSLEFTTAHIRWRQFERQADAPAPNDAQLQLVTDFVNGFFHSHGREEQAQECHARRWYASQNQAFRVMLEQLVAELQHRVRLDDLNLLVLSHWTPDVEVGCSVTNAIIHQTGCDDAFGIAISDHGLSGALLALEVIEDYLDDKDLGGQGKKALLLIADQDAILYDSPALARLNPEPSACVLMLRSLPDAHAAKPPTGITFKHYRRGAMPTTPEALDALLPALAMFTSVEDVLPLLILTTPAFAETLRQHKQLSAHRIESWDESFLSCAPWVRLAQLAPTHQRILLMLPQGEYLTCAGFVARA